MISTPSNQVKLSVVMPVRNEGINLKMMLKILSVTIEVPHEVLVVYDSLDDNSIPVIEEVKKSYPSLKGVHNTSGRGVRKAIEAAVKAASGQFIFVIYITQGHDHIINRDILECTHTFRFSLINCVFIYHYSSRALSCF